MGNYFANDSSHRIYLVMLLLVLSLSFCYRLRHRNAYWSMKYFSIWFAFIYLLCSSFKLFFFHNFSFLHIFYISIFMLLSHYSKKFITIFTNIWYSLWTMQCSFIYEHCIHIEFAISMKTSFYFFHLQLFFI